MNRRFYDRLASLEVATRERSEAIDWERMRSERLEMIQLMANHSDLRDTYQNLMIYCATLSCAHATHGPCIDCEESDPGVHARLADFQAMLETYQAQSKGEPV